MKDKKEGKKIVEIKKLRKQVEEAENNWRRALADYQNLEKRTVQEREKFVKWANATLIDKLLGVLDTLEKAVDHLKDKGLKLALDQFRIVLESEGLKEVKTVAEEFNPETMDAVEMVKGNKNKVVEVVLKGYMLNDKILRPAKVKVGRGKSYE